MSSITYGPIFAQLAKPHIDTGAPIWIPCANVTWHTDSQVKLRPDEWRGAPLPTYPGDDGFERSWAQNPWILARPCSLDTVLKGRLVLPPPYPPAPQEWPNKYSTWLPADDGNVVHFKPDGMPGLTARISYTSYNEIKTGPPAGWQDTLPQQYAALLQKAQQQQASGLW